MSDGTVYIPSSPRSENFSVRAVDAASGEQMWVSEVSRSGFPLFFPLTAVGSNLYVSDDQQVHALDGTTGELVWSFHVGTQVPPTASGGVTYFVELERSEDELVYVLIYALDESTGTLLWSYKADYAALGFPFPPLVVDNVVYLAARELEALDTSTGQRLWSYDVNYPQVSTVVNGMVFVINILGSLYVLDAETGALVWSREDWQLSSVLVVDGVLYADSHDGYLHTLDARTGEPIWSVDIGYQWAPPLCGFRGRGVRGLSARQQRRICLHRSRDYDGCEPYGDAPCGQPTEVAIRRRSICSRPLLPK